MYEALRAQRRELDRQMEELESRREDLSDQIQNNPAMGGPDRAGIEGRIAEIDRRIIDVEKQVALNDAQVAAAAAVPGAVIEQPEPQYVNEGPPEEIIITGIVMSAIVLLPMSIAMARRIWRRSSSIVPAFPAEFWQRLTRLEEAVDSVAMEVERIGEGQRFTNKLFAESRALGAGAAQPVEVKAGESVHAKGHPER